MKICVHFLDADKYYNVLWYQVLRQILLMYLYKYVHSFTNLLSFTINLFMTPRNSKTYTYSYNPRPLPSLAPSICMNMIYGMYCVINMTIKWHFIIGVNACRHFYGREVNFQTRLVGENETRKKEREAEGDRTWTLYIFRK